MNVRRPAGGVDTELQTKLDWANAKVLELGGTVQQLKLRVSELEAQLAAGGVAPVVTQADDLKWCYSCRTLGYSCDKHKPL